MQLSDDSRKTLRQVKEEALANSRLCGRVRKINPEKGYMFVAGDDGQDYFCHWSAFRKASSKTLRQLAIQDRVEFLPIKPPDKNLRGIEIEYVDESGS